MGRAGRSRTSGRLARVALGGVLAMVGAASSVALVVAAGPAATIKATTLTVGPDEDGEGYARCGNGKRALGGGVVQSGPADSLSVRVSGPLDATGVTLETRSGDIPTQWYAAVHNYTAGQRVFKVFAICAAGVAATIKATTLTLDGGHHGEASARCGNGKRALGGGVVQSGPPDFLQVRASGPLDATGITLETRSGDIPTQWYAAVYNGDNKQRTFKVFAVCATGVAATIKATTLTLDPSQEGEASARCRDGKRALGGGVVQSGPLQYFSVDSSGPLDATGITRETRTGDIARQWYAAVVNSGDGERTFKVFAICA